MRKQTKPKRRFSTNEEEMIRDAVQKGVPVMEVASTVGVSKQTICQGEALPRHSVCHSLCLAEREAPSKRKRS